MAAKKIALFIDADNISAKFGKQIIDTLESRGEIFIRRIYGNWEKISLHGWNECILNFSLRAVQQPDFAAGKNATDMSLTIDAMDVLYGGHAEIFALVSNDSDFTPLVIRLREGGMNVIGMGNDNASISFRNACNEFIDLDKNQTSAPPPVPKVEPLPPPPAKVSKKNSREAQSQRDKAERNKRLQQMHSILRETAKTNSGTDGFVYLSRAISAFAKKNYGFEPKNVGYTSWQKFVSAFPKLYAFKGRGATFSYRCLTAEQKSSGDNLQKIHDILHETATAHGDEKGFVNLGQAGSAISQKNINIKDFGYAKLGKFISAFPSLYEVKNNSYRCR
ncbi:MAG: NYN domain-containing protein [Selenomonadaceae bacterium]|nr:NYN domain-containing protein [Selenomonadaceae bacterium]MBQ4494689.1 NYN domain-containing protein [Selenomonadaceae bacterium]